MANSIKAAVAEQKVKYRQAGNGVTPVRSNVCGGDKDEVAGAEQRVGDDETRPGVRPPAPQDQVEVEHAGRPALPAPAAAELALDALAKGEEVGRFEPGFHHGGRIAVAPMRGANRVGQQHRRRLDHLHAFRLQPIERRCEDVARAAVAVMALVGAERDQVAVCQMSSQMRP